MTSQGLRWSLHYLTSFTWSDLKKQLFIECNSVYSDFSDARQVQVHFLCFIDSMVRNIYDIKCKFYLQQKVCVLLEDKNFLCYIQYNNNNKSNDDENCVHVMLYWCENFLMWKCFWLETKATFVLCSWFQRMWLWFILLCYLWRC